MNAGNDPFSQKIVLEARRWLGTPYRHQASLRGVGCDCLGLLRGVWRELYGSEPEILQPYTPDWAETSKGDPLLDAARRHLVPAGEITPGTVILFRWRDGMAAKHIGIATGPDRFIHAYERMAVTKSPLGSHWKRRIAGLFTFPHSSEP